MADGVVFPVAPGEKVSAEEITLLNGGVVAAEKVQRVLLAFRTADFTAVDLPGDLAFGLDVDVTRLPAVALDAATLAALENTTVTVANPATGGSTETTLAAVLAKLTADPATQTTLAAVLAKIPAAPAADGTDITTPTAMPAGGAGIRGWLSAIWTKLNGSLAVTGPATDAQLRLTPLPVSGSVSLGAAIPAGTNAIGTVDLAAATPTAILDAATATATKYIGITVRETSNAATAVVRIRNSGAGGTILDTITLVANESVSYTYPRGRAAASGTVYIQVVSGTVEGSVFTV